MLREIRPAVVMILLMTVLTGLAYPLAMTGVAQLAFPYQANGSLLEKDGKVIGSALVGQSFSGPGYFHGRPSATVGTDPNDPTRTVSAPYNASNSAGSNAGPTAKSLIQRIKDEVEKLKAENPAAPVPIDLVTTSASGLDPDISVEGALFQVPRVARERRLDEGDLRQLVQRSVETRLLGLIGEPRVNVLRLNMALDRLKTR